MPAAAPWPTAAFAAAGVAASAWLLLRGGGRPLLDLLRASLEDSMEDAEEEEEELEVPDVSWGRAQADVSGSHGFLL